MVNYRVVMLFGYYSTGFIPSLFLPFIVTEFVTLTSRFVLCFMSGPWMYSPWQHMMGQGGMPFMPYPFQAQAESTNETPAEGETYAWTL